MVDTPNRLRTGVQATARTLISVLRGACGMWWLLAPLTSLLFWLSYDPESSGLTTSPLAVARLVADEVTLLFAALTALACCLEVVVTRKALPRLLRNGVVFVSTTAFVGLLAMSWALFTRVGQFLDPALFRMGLANAVEILKHVLSVEPLWVIAIPLAALATSFAAGWAFLAARRLSEIRTGHFVLATLAITVACGTAAIAGANTTNANMDRAFLIDSTGPMVYLRGQLFYRLGVESDQYAEAAIGAEPTVPRLDLTDYPGPPQDHTSPGWNVITVVVESLRNDQLESFGGERSVMPVVDAVAAEGVRFTNHRTQASHSDYADITILSSHYPLRDRVYHVYPESPIYPRLLVYDLLKRWGYRVGVFSSQNESWGGMINYLQTGQIDRFLHSETYDGPTYVPRADSGFAAFVKGTKRSGKIDDRFTVDEAIQWMRSAESTPFFVYLNLQNSHFPYERPSDFPPKFGSGSVSFPIGFNNFPPDSASLVLDLYANSLSYVDAQIGRLVDYLMETGQWDRTILVITGDTGQAFYEHGFAAHGGPLYDEVMKVPLIIRSPDLVPGEDERLSQHVDIPPSITSLLQMPEHPGFQGQSLFGPDWGWGRPVFLLSQALAHQYGIVLDGYKLIFDARSGTYQLFDLRADPGETQNLALERPDTMADLAIRLHAWRKAQLQYYGDRIEQGGWYPPEDPSQAGAEGLPEGPRPGNPAGAE